MTPQRFTTLQQVLARRQPDLTILAEGVNKAHNVAALLRTCDAVGVHRAHAVAAQGAMRRHHMIAAGVNRWIDVRVHNRIESAYDALRRDGWRLLAAHRAPSALDYRDVDYTGRTAIVLGAELHGLSRHAIRHADGLISVPMRGMATSLNVSVAGALVLFEAARQREAAGLYDTARIDTTERARTLFEWAYPRIARRCRELGRTYPELTAEGRISTNPLLDTHRTQR